MTTYAYLEPYRERIDKATCEGCREGWNRVQRANRVETPNYGDVVWCHQQPVRHKLMPTLQTAKAYVYVRCTALFDALAPILVEIVQAAEQAATERAAHLVDEWESRQSIGSGEAIRALSKSTSALAEYRVKALERIDLALQAGKTRYSRDHGEPEPTPSFPVEVVFTMPQWDKVLRAIAGKVLEEAEAKR